LRSFPLFASTAAGVVVLDQATKALVLARLALYESVVVLPDFFNLTHVRNPGAAFGLFAGRAASFRTPFFLVATLVALVVILIALKRIGPGERWKRFALALVFGGALGNLVDRLRWGEVVDFLDVFWRTYHWPAFNVADSAITVGVGVLLAAEIFGGRSSGAAR
jgi:signal peptidase II